MPTTENMQAWSTTALTNAGADSAINWAENQDPASVNNSARSMMAAEAKHLDDVGGALVAGGTANALTVTTNQGLSATHLAAGLRLLIRATLANTASAVTFAPDGLTAAPVKMSDGSALTTTSIKSGMYLDLVYNAVASEWRCINLAPFLDPRINIRDYGADPAASAATNTAAIQAAINAAIAIDYTPTWHNFRPVVYFPAGSYTTNELTASAPVCLKGDGRNATCLTLAAGRTGSLLTLGVINRAGTSAEDFDHPRVEGMTLFGNRVDATTTGASHGISCPDPGWAIGTQYSVAFVGVDLMIEGFTGNGISTAVNRNQMQLDKVICRYNNDNGLYLSNNYDHLITQCEIGNNKNAGIYENLSFNSKISLSDIYFNDYNIRRDNCGGPSMYSGCTIQAAARDGVLQAGGVGPMICNCFFLENSRTTDNVSSNVLFTGAVEYAAITGCYFQYVSGNRVKWLVSGLAGVTLVSFAGNVFSNSTLAYGTGTFDAPYKMAIAGDVSGQIVHGPGADSLVYAKAAGIIDGIATPTTVGGVAFIYVDGGTGDLRVRFGDGVDKLIVVDT
jgi:hypothetical protein